MSYPIPKGDIEDGQEEAPFGDEHASTYYRGKQEN